jgi:DNA adenine methylase
MTVAKEARPFVKSAGGKTQLLDELRKNVPTHFDVYLEPFVGGGALFFDLRGRGLRSAVLGDASDLLINAYTWVRDDVEAVIARLAILKKKHSKEFYYAHRKVAFTNMRDTVEGAASYIYFSKTCFNGLWRVNRDGGFNVPMGKYTNPGICDEAGLRAASAALQGVRLCANGFQVTSDLARQGDFVYFDPPYWPRGGESYFTDYTPGGFDSMAQERLRNTALELKRRGVHVLLSNADVAPVRKLYAEGFETRRVKAARNINSKVDKRGDVGELLIW